jgi:hypothetical protein
LIKMGNKPGDHPKQKQNLETIVPSKPNSTPAKFWFFRSALVLNLLVGGLGRLMQSISFSWFVILGYAFFILIGVELWNEPLVRKFRFASCPVLLAATIWFTIAVPFAKAPLGMAAYVRPSDYSNGTKVEGISWDSHFTDLRIGITNATEDDYRDVDISIRPDGWTHEAAFLRGGVGCQLSRAGGNALRLTTASKSGKLTVTARRTGDVLENYDDSGNVYATVASESGYRLICGRIPSHDTILMFFALVTVPRSLIQTPNMPGIGLTVSALALGTNWLDVLGSKPCPQEVFVLGKYVRDLKPYSIIRRLKVGADLTFN